MTKRRRIHIAISAIFFALSVWLLFISAPLWAETITVSWTNATLNEDGSDIPATGGDALASTTIYFGLCDAGDLVVGPDTSSTTVTPDIMTTPLELPDVAGEYCLRAIHTNNDGIESDLSNLATRTVVIVTTPGAPQGLIVEPDNLTAYTFDKIRGGLSVYPIGIVPPGTECDAGVEVNGMNAVPAELVVYPPGVSLDPFVVIALCGAGSGT